MTTSKTTRPATTAELKLRIANCLDVVEFLDVLGWELGDLLGHLDEEVFEENFEDLLRACD